MLRLHSRQEAGLWLPIGDQTLTAKINASRGFYDSDSIEAAMRYVKNRRMAVDVGAHIGMMTRQFASRFDEVIAFEPDSRHFEYLTLNTQNIGNVKRFPMALGARTKRIRMSVTGVGHSTCSFVEETTRLRRNWSFMTTLDAFELAEVDLLKIDVEGFECDVIDGASETIERCRPVIILEENSWATRYHRQVGEAREKLIDMGMVDVERIRVQEDTINVILTWPQQEAVA